MQEFKMLQCKMLQCKGYLNTRAAAWLKKGCSHVPSTLCRLPAVGVLTGESVATAAFELCGRLLASRPWISPVLDFPGPGFPRRDFCGKSEIRKVLIKR